MDSVAKTENIGIKNKKFCPIDPISLMTQPL
jgi:hypothetical protein